MRNISIESERLLKLAAHLRGGKLYEAGDSYSVLPSLSINSGTGAIRFYDFPFRECVHIFEEWTFSPEGFPVLKGISSATTTDSAMAFFNLGSQSFQHLFSPYSQYIRLFGGRVLHRSSRRDIAFNIKHLVEMRTSSHKKIAA